MCSMLIPLDAPRDVNPNSTDNRMTFRRCFGERARRRSSDIPCDKLCVCESL